MKEYLQQLGQWRENKKGVALARVINTWGSSPRPVGSVMLISSDLEMAGSVSGGCVEGAVLREAKQNFETKAAKRLAYGVSDDDAWAVGLSCGGKLQVFLQGWEADAVSKAVEDNLRQNRGCVLVTKVVDGEVSNTLIDGNGNATGAALSDRLVSQAKEAYQLRSHCLVAEEDGEYFVQVFPPRSKLVIIGAAHITADLIQLGHSFDFETIVIDPRKTFARNTTFQVPHDRLYEAYPSEVLGEIELDPYTYAVILSHDPKIDDDALKILLKKPVAYIGALGSKKNHEKRKGRLTGYGFSEEEIATINAPIGIDIHAKGAREIALSIMGAVIAAKNKFQ